MQKQSKQIYPKHGKLIGERWFYCLPNPFRVQHCLSLPLDANDLANNLNISYRSALRICQNERPLKDSELIYLQVIHFGLIPDKAFIKAKFFVSQGSLRCHRVSNYELSTGELMEYSLLRMQVLTLRDELKTAKETIKTLQGEPKPTNIIQFSDFFKR